MHSVSSVWLMILPHIYTELTVQCFPLVVTVMKHNTRVVLYVCFCLSGSLIWWCFYVSFIGGTIPNVNISMLILCVAFHLSDFFFFSDEEGQWIYVLRWWNLGLQKNVIVNVIGRWFFIVSFSNLKHVCFLVILFYRFFLSSMSRVRVRVTHKSLLMTSSCRKLGHFGGKS